MPVSARLLSLLLLLQLYACNGSDSNNEEGLPFEQLQPLPPLVLDDPYDLPDPLVSNNGSAVTNANDWWFQRRGEIQALFETHVYGKTPTTGLSLRHELIESDEQALSGLATRKQIRIVFGDQADSPAMDLLIYLPNSVDGQAPMFLISNFQGNHSTHSDPEIILPTNWVPDSSSCGSVNNTAQVYGRGCRSSRYPIESILARGYGFATLYSGDLDPDKGFGFGTDDPATAFEPLFYQGGQTEPSADEWGAVGVWAWGLSRAMDYLEIDDDIDTTRVSVLGHSRLGKTALWAGAQDSRFAAVISNDSGAVGAALSRRAIGETVSIINILFPHWFADNFLQYGNNEDLLPVDQHMLIALMAPRPVYIASAEGDAWADPEGEFLSGVYASNVYRLLGREGLAVQQLPAVNQAVTSIIGYHIRSGEHDLTEYDWQRFMDFTDIHLGN